MYENCLKCDHLGKDCDGPNFIAMEPHQLADWCISRKEQFPHLTFDKISDLTHVSKSTVNGFFNKKHEDYYYNNIRKIVELLLDGEWDDNPCAIPPDTERAELMKKIEHLEETAKWRDEKIADLQNTNAQLQTLVANTNARYTKDKDFLRSIIIVLAICFGICLLVIIGALVIDRLNPDIGFFWLRGWFGDDSGLQTTFRGIT